MPVDNSHPDSSSDGYRARQLLRSVSFATLATLDQVTGTPYASLVQIATEPDATPVLLISQLARHTRNLATDPRASLLIDRREHGDDPLASHRVTLMGRARPHVTPHGRSRFLQRHPSARQFAGFADFGFWALQVEMGHCIAGFGRIREIAGTDIVLGPDDHRASDVASLAAEENTLLQRLAAAGTMAAGGSVTGPDIEGFDVRSGAAMQRELFASAIDDPTTAHQLIQRHFTKA